MVLALRYTVLSDIVLRIDGFISRQFVYLTDLVPFQSRFLKDKIVDKWTVCLRVLYMECY